MIIELKSQGELINDIVGGLLHPEYPTSWNVVIPPAFGEDNLTSQLEWTLRKHHPEPLVSSISSDAIRHQDGYVEQLWQQWNKTISLPRPDDGISINLRLEKLFALLPSDRAAVQILCRFHKILVPFPINKFNFLIRLRRSY